MDSSKLGSRLLIRDQTISILISNFLNSYKMLWYYLIYSLFISIHGKKVMRVIGNLFVFRGQCAGWRIFKYILEIHRKKMYCVAILNSYIFCGGKLTIIIFLNQFSMEYLLSVHKIIYKLTTFYKISVYHNVFDRCLKCDLRYFYITSCIRKIVQIHHYTFMYICMRSVRCAHQYFKDGWLQPSTLSVFTFSISQSQNFPLCWPFCLIQSNDWDSNSLNYLCSYIPCENLKETQHLLRKREISLWWKRIYL